MHVSWQIIKLVWDNLDIIPDEQLFAEARASPNPCYLADLRRRCKERGLEDLEFRTSDSWSRYYTHDKLMEPSSIYRQQSGVSAFDIGWDQDEPFDGRRADASIVELFACMAGGNLAK